MTCCEIPSAERSMIAGGAQLGARVVAVINKHMKGKNMNIMQDDGLDRRMSRRVILVSNIETNSNSIAVVRALAVLTQICLRMCGGSWGCMTLR